MNFEEEMDRDTLKRLKSRDPEPTNADLSDGIQMILRHLWPKEELEKLIEQKHKSLCAECPYRPKELSELAYQNDADAEPKVRDIAGGLYEFALAVVKSPWFWIPVSTVCAIVCSRYNISLPVVGGGN